MIRNNVLTRMLLLETAAAEWFTSMSANEQKAYLHAHPASKLGGARGRAVLHTYLRPGSDGERNAAANHLTKMGVKPPRGPHDHLDAPRTSRFDREEIRVKPRRSRPADVHSDAKPRKRTLARDGVHTGTSATDISGDLQHFFKAGPATEEGYVLSHRIKEPNADKLHHHLISRGWKHTEKSVTNGHRTVIHHDFRHPDGGRIVHTHHLGSGMLSGKDRHTVHAHGDIS